ncbi:MAG: corrinoid protein [Coriobacteriales bacterium]|jgi:corrinoid protein of di/trimethylamine methyltransferase|nr:corrinoid protein [Coriobacteriales bacterium]
MAILDDISAAVQSGKKNDVIALVERAVDEGVAPDTILQDGLVSAMDIVGDKFSKGDIFVPEMLVAARAMSAATEILKPLLVAEGTEPLGKACIGTVKGDMHDIGKNLVRMMLEGKGIEVIDLGVDVAPETFVECIRENEDLGLVCASALLTTTLPALRDTVVAITESGLRSRVKILVGGAPVTQEYADEIGADAYTKDAGSAGVRAAQFFTE